MCIFCLKMLTDADLKAIFKATTEKLISEIYKDYGMSRNVSKQTLTKFVDNYPINIKFVVKDKKQPVQVKEEERCQARTWNDGFMDIKKYRKNKVNNIDDGTIYGGLCNKKVMPNSLYCSCHDADLVHGNYYFPPTPLVRGFFHKVNSYRL